MAAQFRGLIDAAPDGIVVVDGAGVIVLVNQQAEAIFEYDRDELIGQTVELLLPDRLRAGHVEHRALFGREPKTRPMGTTRDIWGRRRNGEEFPADVSLAPIMEPDGTVFTVAAVRDVSERMEHKRDLEGLLYQAQAIRADAATVRSAVNDFAGLTKAVTGRAFIVVISGTVVAHAVIELIGRLS